MNAPALKPSTVRRPDYFEQQAITRALGLEAELELRRGQWTHFDLVDGGRAMGRPDRFWQPGVHVVQGLERFDAEGNRVQEGNSTLRISDIKFMRSGGVEPEYWASLVGQRVRITEYDGSSHVGLMKSFDTKAGTSELTDVINYRRDGGEAGAAPSQQVLPSRMLALAPVK